MTQSTSCSISYGFKYLFCNVSKAISDPAFSKSGLFQLWALTLTPESRYLLLDDRNNSGHTVLEIPVYFPITSTQESQVPSNNIPRKVRYMD